MLPTTSTSWLWSSVPRSGPKGKFCRTSFPMTGRCSCLRVSMFMQPQEGLQAPGRDALSPSGASATTVVIPPWTNRPPTPSPLVCAAALPTHLPVWNDWLWALPSSTAAKEFKLYRPAMFAWLLVLPSQAAAGTAFRPGLVLCWFCRSFDWAWRSLPRGQSGTRQLATGNGLRLCQLLLCPLFQLKYIRPRLPIVSQEVLCKWRSEVKMYRRIHCPNQVPLQCWAGLKNNGVG